MVQGRRRPGAALTRRRRRIARDAGQLPYGFGGGVGGLNAGFGRGLVGVGGSGAVDDVSGGASGGSAALTVGAAEGSVAAEPDGVGDALAEADALGVGRGVLPPSSDVATSTAAAVAPTTASAMITSTTRSPTPLPPLLASAEGPSAERCASCSAV